MKTAIFAIFAAATSLPSLAFAQGPAPQTLHESSMTSAGMDPGKSSDGPVLTHEGFMLRMSGGVALLGAGIEPEQKLELGAGGGGQAFSLSVGGYVIPNLALSLDILGASSDHAVTATDEEGSRQDADHFTVGAAGMGITYYIMPYNLAFSGSLMLGQMSLRAESGPTYRTDYAVFGKFGIAKQWPVSDYWGLGLGASALVGYGQGESSNDEDFDTGIGGLSIDFVATYD